MLLVGGLFEPALRFRPRFLARSLLRLYRFYFPLPQRIGDILSYVIGPAQQQPVGGYPIAFTEIHQEPLIGVILASEPICELARSNPEVGEVLHQLFLLEPERSDRDTEPAANLGAMRLGVSRFHVMNCRPASASRRLRKQAARSHRGMTLE